MAVAYSYLRFSSPAQASGDSLRRQTAARDTWLAQHPDVVLDTRLRMTDAGKSAFRRDNFDSYALGQFVETIKSGDVERGSFLLLENLDRLSRETAGEALELFLGIVNRGVVIVQLLPTAIEFRKPVEPMQLMYAICELSRGNSESEAKSIRGRANWQRKQKEAGTRLVTKRLPGWISCVGGKLQLNQHAATIRRIFKMAIEGNGALTIAKAFNDEGVSVIGRKVMKGRKVHWSGRQVGHILGTKATLGEYRPYGNDPKKTPGDVVPNYFPPVIDEATFHAAQAAVAARAVVGRGRRGKHVNIFSGMLTDWRDGATISYAHEARGSRFVAGGQKLGLPCQAFEDAVLSQLRELDTRGLTAAPNAPGKVKLLEGRLAANAALTSKWEAKMGNIAIIDKVEKKLTELAAERTTLETELAAAGREAANPLTRAWEQTHELIDTLVKDRSDENRLRLRASIRRTVESVTAIFLPTEEPGKKLALAKVGFHGADTSRCYAIALEAKRWVAFSVKEPAAKEIDTPRHLVSRVMEGIADRLKRLAEGKDDAGHGAGFTSGTIG